MFCPSCKKNVLPGVTLCPDCFGPLLSLRTPATEQPTGALPAPEPPVVTLPVPPPAPANPAPPLPALRRPRDPHWDRYPDPPKGSPLTWVVAAALAAALGAGAYQLYKGLPAGTRIPTVAASSPGAELPTARAAFEKAKVLHAQHQYAEAITQARMALSLLGPNGSPEVAREMMEQLALSYQESGDATMAEGCYRELLKYYPDDSSYNAGLRRAEATLQAENNAAAAENWKQARAAYDQGQWKTAAELAEYAASLNMPQTPPRECLALAGRAYGHLNDYKMAASSWSQVLRLSPHNPEASRGLAQARSHLGRDVAVKASQPAPSHPAPPSAGGSARVASLPGNPTYPTFHKGHDEEFFGPDSPKPSKAPKTPRRPHRSRPSPGGDDPYSKGPSEGEKIPQLPPLPGGATAQAPQVPRLPSLSVPASNGGSNIPGLSSNSKPKDDTLPGYSSGNTMGSSGLPGYNTQKGQRQSTTGGLPGY